jgi:hypothetical protein
MVEHGLSENDLQKTPPGRWRPGARMLLAVAVFSGLFVWRFLIPRGPAPVRRPIPPGAAGHEDADPGVAYEPTDWPLGPIGLIFLGTLALLVISCVVLIAAYRSALPDVDREVRIAPPGPRLQTNPEADLARFRAEEARRLNTYYWIDKQKGIVHIPIEQAMQNLASAGIPGFPKGKP